MWTGEKHGYDWYEWCVFVDEPENVVRQIGSVEYVLHPTFPEPVRLLTDKETRFALFSSGWGGFRIGVTLAFEDGQKVSGSYHLRLKKGNWPTEAQVALANDDNLRDVYNALAGEKYRWRKVETITRRTGLPQNEAE